MDYTQIKNEHERYEWCVGRLTGLMATTRYDIPDELRSELKEILFVMENL